MEIHICILVFWLESSTATYDRGTVECFNHNSHHGISACSLHSEGVSLLQHGHSQLF